ncbi:hypothetical protein ACFLW3_02295 [Chloroflexota bacterium]
MTRKLVSIAGCFLLLATLSTTALACQKDNAEPSYAGEMTESILLAMNANDYTLFTEEFGPEMKETMTEAAFAQTRTAISSIVGDYTPDSKQFVNTVTDDKMVTVIYQAGFSNEPAGVSVNITFEQMTGRTQISGFWLNSPKLRGE